MDNQNKEVGFNNWRSSGRQRNRWRGLIRAFAGSEWNKLTWGRGGDRHAFAFKWIILWWLMAAGREGNKECIGASISLKEASTTTPPPLLPHTYLPPASQQAATPSDFLGASVVHFLLWFTSKIPNPLPSNRLVQLPPTSRSLRTDGRGLLGGNSRHTHVFSWSSFCIDCLTEKSCV